MSWRVQDGLMCLHDLYATFAALAGVTDLQPAPSSSMFGVDALDMSSLLLGRTTESPRPRAPTQAHWHRVREREGRRDRQRSRRYRQRERALSFTVPFTLHLTPETGRVTGGCELTRNAPRVEIEGLNLAHLVHDRLADAVHHLDRARAARHTTDLQLSGCFRRAIATFLPEVREIFGQR